MASLTPAPQRPPTDGSGDDGEPDLTPLDPPTAVARRNRRPLAAVAAALVLGALATWGLGRKDLWVDEAISLGATGDLVATWRGTGGTMALYYALLTPWTWISTDPTWLRALSVAFSVAAIAFVWIAARRAFDQRVAALTVAFTAGAYLVVRYAQEARSYGLVLLLTSISWAALVATARADHAGDEASARRWWRVFVVATVLAPLAHGLAALQLLGQVALVAMAPDRRRWFERLRVVVIGVAAVTGLLVVLGASDVASWIPPISLAQLGDLAAALTGPSLAAQLVLGAALVSGAATCVTRSRRLRHPLDRWLALVPIAWGLVPVALLLVASLARPYLLARYVTASAPGLAMLLAFAVLGPGRTVRAWRAAVVAVPVVVLLAVGQVQLHQEEGDGWQEAAAAVGAQVRPDDLLVLPNPSVRSPFDAAWSQVADDGALTPVPFSPVEPVGEVRRFYTVRSPEVLAAQVVASDADRVWLVDQVGIGFEDSLAPFLDDRAIADAFEVVERAPFDGGVQVVLLERS